MLSGGSGVQRVERAWFNVRFLFFWAEGACKEISINAKQLDYFSQS